MTERIETKHNLPPVSRGTWLLLREFSLRKTREEKRLVTQGEIVEQALTEYFEKNIK